MKKLLIILLCSSFFTGVAAQPLRLKPGHPLHYTVKPGDSLWEIACKFLEDPLQWHELLAANPEISDPEKIYPGEVLNLSIVNGHPRLHREAGGTVVLSPQVQVTQLSTAIPAIPENAIRPFLNASAVVGRDELSKAPFVVANAGEHIVGGLGDVIYVEGIKSRSVNARYLIYRRGIPYVDPQTKELLGFAAISVGEAQMTVPGSPATMVLINANLEVLTGDRLLPFDETTVLHDLPLRLPKQHFRGQILNVINGVTQIGQYQVVAINLGKKQGLKIGDVLAVYQLGKLVKGPGSNTPIKLPNERAGVLVVFRTFERVSYAIILKAITAIHVLDEVVTPSV